MKLKMFLSIFVLIGVVSSNAQSVKWISSTNNSRWQKQNNLQLNDYKDSVPVTVEINTADKQQVIEGWGGCFNELGWDALSKLDAAKRNAVLKEFFDPKEGLKYNLCRMPIGANDYSRNWYSLDDTPDDFEMKHFSIERDKGVLIPYIKLAMKYQPKLKMWASPWSPPIWMKTNKHYANKPGDHNDLTEANSVKSGDQFIQQEKYLSAYALYLSKFVNSYQKEGINVAQVHFQNEPFTYNQWPNCKWTAPAMRDFVSKYLGPTFQKENVNADIWFGTMNNDNLKMFDTVLTEADARKYIKGVGLQWEGREVVGDLYKKYQGLNLMQTETECGEGTFDWKSAEHTFGLFKRYLSGGVSAYMYWNMILDETGQSSWGWKQNAQVTINKKTKEVVYTPEFYLMKHFSYFVTPGSKLIKVKGNFNDLLAFETPNGKKIIIAANRSDLPETIKVKIDGKLFTVSLAQHSFNTFEL